MRKKIWTGAVLAVILAIAAVAVSPYWALERIKRAADQHDAATLSAYVDFPQVQESLKTSLHDSLRKQLNRQSQNPLEGFALALGGWVSDRMVEALLSPQSIAALLRGESVSPLEPSGNPPATVPPPSAADSSGTSTQPAAPAPASSGPGTSDNQRAKLSAGYEDFSHFVIRVYRRGQPDKPVLFTMTRQGLFDWKLTAIQLPPL
ncbi:hypothetical protein PATSB16_11470 [Pandoraea thiooxydans]|uniref:DUF2939 domain-containing protein n=1 Tax=Pandoraea thiooxydans TaxID=445709 RepID=A0A0G3EN98_9BURK|nr:DUF2939 domain-containing protein [Pandoraea thiooxydans]AKJ67454.1 hypothetical protein ABW99_03595 [Pandoraea thiooxydans]APR94489.1 hypothetical protein PATSB16_11470 [Pandoraea thiooxydans]